MLASEKRLVFSFTAKLPDYRDGPGVFRLSWFQPRCRMVHFFSCLSLAAWWLLCFHHRKPCQEINIVVEIDVTMDYFLHRLKMLLPNESSLMDLTHSRITNLQNTELSNRFRFYSTNRSIKQVIWSSVKLVVQVEETWIVPIFLLDISSLLFHEQLLKV